LYIAQQTMSVQRTKNEVIAKYKNAFARVVTKNDLIVAIKGCGVKGYSKMKKDELIDVLEKQNNNSEYSVFEMMVNAWYLKHKQALDIIDKDAVAQFNKVEEPVTDTESVEIESNSNLQEVPVETKQDDEHYYNQDIDRFAEVLYESDVELNKTRVMNKRCKKADKERLLESLLVQLEARKADMIKRRIAELRSMTILNIATNMKRNNFQPESQKLKDGISEYEQLCQQRAELFDKQMDSTKIVVFTPGDNGMLQQVDY
jgi:hypothetical protein